MDPGKFWLIILALLVLLLGFCFGTLLYHIQ